MMNIDEINNLKMLFTIIDENNINNDINDNIQIKFSNNNTIFCDNVRFNLPLYSNNQFCITNILKYINTSKLLKNNEIYNILISNIKKIIELHNSMNNCNDDIIDEIVKGDFIIEIKQQKYIKNNLNQIYETIITEKKILLLMNLIKLKKIKYY